MYTDVHENILIFFCFDIFIFPEVKISNAFCNKYKSLTNLIAIIMWPLYLLCFYHYQSFVIIIINYNQSFFFVKYYQSLITIIIIDNFQSFLIIVNHHHSYSFYYHYYFIPWQFFTSVLADGFPQEFEWQQASSILQDSSQYSGKSQQWCSFDSLHPSRYFQVLHSLYQYFRDCTKSTNYNWYNRLFHVLQFFFFQFPSKVKILIALFAFFQFYSVIRPASKVHNPASSLFFCWLL